MEKILKIKKERCPHNHQCRAVKACPVGALLQNINEVPRVIYDKCIKCGKCLKLCPKKALVLEQGN